MTDFKYEGFATNWIGFKYEFDGKFYTVVREEGFREYIVTYPGSADLHATQYDLMHEYIKQLLFYKTSMSKVLEKMR